MRNIILCLQIHARHKYGETHVVFFLLLLEVVVDKNLQTCNGANWENGDTNNNAIQTK